MKKCFQSLVFLLFFSVASLFFFVSAQAKESNIFVVGTTSGYAPFVSLNAKGKYEGFDIDYSHELANKLNKKLVIKDYGSMNSLMLALNQNKVDTILWAISITEERKKNMEMIYYHGEKITRFPLVFWKNVPSDFKTIDDLSKNPKNFVCVEAGSSQEAVMRCYPKLKLRYTDKITDAIMEIKYGKSIATTIDHSLLPTMVAQNPELKIVWMDLPQSEQSYGIGICLNKNSKKLSVAVREAVKQIKEDDILEKLEKKWNLVN